MKNISLLTLVLLAGCGASQQPRQSEVARGICRENGHQAGSEAFNQCFNATFATLINGTQSRMAGASTRMQTACNRVGNAVICN